MNKITVLFFATLRTLAKCDSLQLTLKTDATVKDLKKTLGTQIPALKTALPSTLISINREFAFDEDKIPHNAEIALFPPVSGG
jgi:molybdopterin synthase catalytic subunit